MALIILIIGIIIGCIAMFFTPRIFSIVAILLCFFIGIIKIISVGFSSFMNDSKVDNADLVNCVIGAIFFCTAIICYHLRYVRGINSSDAQETREQKNESTIAGEAK